MALHRSFGVISEHLEGKSGGTTALVALLLGLLCGWAVFVVLFLFGLVWFGFLTVLFFLPFFLSFHLQVMIFLLQMSVIPGQF